MERHMYWYSRPLLLEETTTRFVWISTIDLGYFLSGSVTERINSLIFRSIENIEHTYTMLRTSM